MKFYGFNKEKAIKWVRNPLNLMRNDHESCPKMNENREEQAGLEVTSQGFGIQAAGTSN